MKIIYRAFYVKDGQGDLAMLRGLSGNTIILITDGRQECLYPSRPECLTITSVKGDLIARKIRVITIALGDEADPEIEDLALSTGGKSYYVEDGSGAGGYFCRFCVTIIAAMVRSFLSSSSCQHFLLNDLKHYFSRRGCH